MQSAYQPSEQQAREEDRYGLEQLRRGGDRIACLPSEFHSVSLKKHAKRLFDERSISQHGFGDVHCIIQTSPCNTNFAH